MDNVFGDAATPLRKRLDADLILNSFGTYARFQVGYGYGFSKRKSQVLVYVLITSKEIGKSGILTVMPFISKQPSFTCQADNSTVEIHFFTLSFLEL